MSPTRSTFSSAFISVAVWLSLVPVTALIEGSSVLIAALPMLLASALVGCGLALLRAPGLVRLAAQCLAIVGVLGWQCLTLAGGGDPLSAARLLTASGVEAIRAGAPPIAPDAGVIWLCLVLAALLVVVVEVLAGLLDQPAWAIAPLALVFGIAAMIVVQELPWWHAAPVVAAFLLVLLSSNSEGRDATGATPQRFHVSRAGVVAAAGAICVTVALVASLAIPLGPKQPWNQAGNDGPIQLADPTVKLNQDLRRPTDDRVFTYSASDGQPHYLRTVALPELSANGARLTPMQLSRFGMDSAYSFPGERVEVDVSMAEVPSEYLPAPFAPREIRADGQWSYDPATMSIVSSGEDRLNQTVNLDFRVVSVMPNPSQEEVEAAGAGSGVDDVNSEVPPGLDAGVATLTASVVEGADTAGEQALAIQQFLRSDAFTYSLNAPNSSGTDAISSFLLTDRSGYCIHFAAAMITMARIQGIPARMAIGFTPGEELPEGGFEVTAHDAHAWAELYLEGLGWVPFEPTPAFDGPPAYTDPAAAPSEEPSAEPTETPEETPETPSASAEPSPEPGQSDGPEESDGQWGAWLLGSLVALLALAGPALTRLTQRGLRLRPGQPADEAADRAWREVRCLFADYGLPWPSGSPGPAAAKASGSLPPDTAETLRSIAGQVERSRFAREGASSEHLAEEVRQLRSQLRAEASPGRRTLAVLLAPSLWRRSDPGRNDPGS